MPRPAPHPLASTPQGGSALVWSLLFVVVTSAMVISHSIFLASHRTSSEVRFSQEALVQNMARSALVEAAGWFRRQPVQPVTTFDPQYDPLAEPPRFDTIDPSIGLVREFEISSNLWGRYEVRNADVVDISAQRGSSQPGAAWDIGVRAYVYRRTDPTVSFDTAPNRILATSAVGSEIRGITVQLPVLAAINIGNVNQLNVLGVDVAIDGGGKPGVSYDSLVVPVLPIDLSIVGVPASTGTVGLDLSAESIFGMPLGDLHSYADTTILDADRRGTPVQVADQVVTAVRPAPEAYGFVLESSLLVIDGDLTLQAGSISKVDGVMYVNGSLVVNGELTVNGALVVTNAANFVGKTRVFYDDAKITSVVQKLARYRLPRVVTPVSDF